MKATLEMALEALTNPSVIAVQHAVELIQAELAKPEQEVRWFQQFGDAPPRKPWVGLTDDEMLNTLIEIDSKTVRLPIGFKLFACAIEAKLKEKNT